MLGEKRKVLLSGFEPFGGSRLNPSQLLVEKLSQSSIEGVELAVIVLPVEFERATELLLAKIKDFNPDVVIAFGQAEGRKAITPEKIAINLDNARMADNSGDQRLNRVIDPHGNDGYFSTLPVEKMIEAITSAGIPAELSLSAGNFVCNHVFYELQRALIKTEIKTGFVHLPLIAEQSPEFPGQPTMALEELVRGARAAILSTL